MAEIGPDEPRPLARSEILINEFRAAGFLRRALILVQLLTLPHEPDTSEVAGSR